MREELFTACLVREGQFLLLVPMPLNPMLYGKFPVPSRTEPHQNLTQTSLLPANLRDTFGG